MSANMSGNRPSPERPSVMWPCGNIERHDIPATWTVAYPNHEHNSTLACNGCLKMLVEAARKERKALTFQPLHRPAQDAPEASSNCRSTSGDSSVTRSEVSTNLNGNDPQVAKQLGPRRRDGVTGCACCGLRLLPLTDGLCEICESKGHTAPRTLADDVRDGPYDEPHP